MQSRDRWIRLLAVGGVAGQVIFTVGWLVGGWVQDVAYSSARHAIAIIACGWIATLAVQVVRVGVPAAAPVPA